MQRLRAESDINTQPATQASHITSQQCTSNTASVKILCLSLTSALSTKQNNTTACHQVDAAMHTSTGSQDHLIVLRDYSDRNIFANCAMTSPNTSYLQSICSNFNLAFLPNMSSQHSGHDVVACELEDLIHSKTGCSVHVEIFQIIGDGNCLFRALSLAFCQTENMHCVIRSYIVNHTLDANFTAVLQTFCERNVSNGMQFQHYLQSMQQDGHWGTEIEIIAAAHLFDCSIMCCSRYGLSGSLCIQHFTPHFVLSASCATTCDHPVIYLVNSSGNHYELQRKSNS